MGEVGKGRIREWIGESLKKGAEGERRIETREEVGR